MTTYKDQQRRWKAMGYTPPRGRDRCPTCGWHVPTCGHPEGCPMEGKR